MPYQLVECIPNFSEGRRPEVVGRIVEAMKAVSGARVLDVNSDASHNRSVVTMVGSPEAMIEAVFAGIRMAAQLIDLDQHQGEHPRIGATDVVPFVPVRGITMHDCVKLACRLGERVGRELEIPVYLYEAAATRPERINLADIRRGEYEALKKEMGRVPARDPDFGPARVGPSGVTAIGARPSLIACNVYLNTDRVEIARYIAKAIRHSSGGFRHVKALGLLVGGQAQVSMNLTDFAGTPIHEAMEFVRREARRYGVLVSHSELVGLVPQQALLDSAAWYLQLQLDPNQVLENRLQWDGSGGIDQDELASFSRYLDLVAAETPVPGGGSLAALSGAMAASLVAMVARLTIGRKKYETVQEEMPVLVRQADALRKALTARAAEDAQSYEAVVAAHRMPKETLEEREARSAAIQISLSGAACAPLMTARDALEVLRLAETAAHSGNSSTLSDAGTALYLASAAFEGAVMNVRINAVQMSDQQEAAAMMDEVAELRGQFNEVFAAARQAVDDRW